MPVRVKICGVTTLADARAAVDAGADALGLNFWPQSPRRCAMEAAARIAAAVGHTVRLVGVVVDASDETLAAIRDVGVPWLQLHGDEPPERITELGPKAFKALHVGTPAELDRALGWPGDELLVDARVEGLPGGTGTRCDWDLAARLATERALWLAGGLTPENVAEAVRRVRPLGVDVASGVESAPGVKDVARVADFIAAARAISVS